MSTPDGNNRVRPWGWRDWAMLALLALGTAFALWWYWGRAPHPYSDTTMTIFRAFEVDHSIARGVLYPRLAMDFNFTYGAPLLEYRPPLVHYVIPVLHWSGLGWIDAAKATATLELLLAAIGMYIYARWLFADRRAALVSAGAYLFAPYLLMDIQERGAIVEAAALAVLPWLFWAMHHTLRTEHRLWPWLGALFTALLILAHNIVAFFAIPVLLLYLCLLAWRGQAWQRMPAVIAALAAGLGLSAFYWMPALLERNDAQIVSNMLYDSPSTRLSPLSEWIQRQLVFDYWGPLRRRLSLWQAVLAIMAILALAITAISAPEDPKEPALGAYKRLSFNMALLVGITAGAMLLQLDVSLSFWRVVPLVRFIQFPTRLLGIAAFCIALLAGFLFIPLKRAYRKGRLQLGGAAGWIAVGGLLVVIIYSSTRTLAPPFNPHVSQLSEDAVSLEELFERGRSYFTLFSDFLPVGVRVDTSELANPRAAPDRGLPSMTYVPDIVVTGERPFRLDLQVRADQPFTLRFHRFFFPGWQVYATGKPVPTGLSGSLGLVTADLPAGEYPVTVQFGQTPVRSLADIITVVSLLAFLAAGIAIRRARPILVAMAGALVLVAILLFARHGTGDPPGKPVAYPATFQVEGSRQGDEIRLLGYDLPEKTWRPGDDLPLHLYWLAPRTPADDYKVFIHLVKPDDSAKVAQSDSMPILGYGPTTRWEPGEIIPDEHQIHLDENVAPGKYLLLIGMYRPETMQNLPVHGAAKVLPGDRVVLAEIEVQGK